ncbi:MAG TPA: CoA transferase [Ohtaekwangia sp.]|nr:CoA transferase [Ohtaekwangia sp.]
MDFFNNIRVLELASVLAGPSVGQFFAELGAAVIKVENMHGGDVTRHWKTKDEKSDDRSAYFCAVNWGKRSIALDLNSPEGKAIVHKLAKGSQIVISSYKPGDAEKLGVDYLTLSSLNPSLIYGQITGYGPDVHRVGYDAVIQAESGFMFMNGEPGGTSLKMPVALIDVLAAHHLKEGILLALLNAYHFKKGGYVSVSLVDAAVSSLVNQATNYLMTGKIPTKQGSSHPNIAPYGDIFRSKDDVELILAVGSNKQFISLCEILNIAHLVADERFSSNVQRVRHREELNVVIQNRIIDLEAADLMTLLVKQNIPGGVVQNLHDVFSSPSLQHLIYKAGCVSGIRSYVGNSSVVKPDLSPPPHYGEHTIEILNELDR